MSKRPRELKKFKVIHIGDIVERISGAHVGLTGKVICCKPRYSLWTTHIKVDVDVSEYTYIKRKRLRIFLMKKWSSVMSWKKIGK